jgi:hypothetical protein
MEQELVIPAPPPDAAAVVEAKVYPANAFPKMVYHHSEKPLTVNSAEELEALHEDWKESPALVTKQPEVAEVDKKTPFEKLAEIAKEATEFRAALDAEKAALDHERNLVASEKGKLADDTAKFEAAKAQFAKDVAAKEKKAK